MLAVTRDARGAAGATGIVCRREVTPVVPSCAASCAAEMAVKAIDCSTMMGIRNCA